MSDFAIVVIGYNRVDSMERLLNSLNNVDYCGQTLPIFISIDTSGSDIVERFAHEFIWKHGKKTVLTYLERLGLRNHILKCGQLTEQYDSIAVFEDDIYVSPNFYNYMKLAVEFYNNNQHIAGISLYNHLWHPGVNRFFTAEHSQYDTYFLQFAQSWGQIWFKKPWQDFIEWYKSNNEEFEEYFDMPDYVTEWPKSSWLKYHIKYCIKNDKYFVYPYISISTNFADSGEHVIISNSTYQVPLQFGIKTDYNFAPFDQNCIKYDAFFERQELGKYLGVDEKKICVDIYGQKKNNQYRKYWLTMEKIDCQIINSFALKLRPHEMNIIMDIGGQDIFLYDTTIKKKNANKEEFELKQNIYDIRDLHTHSLIRVTKYRILNMILNLLKRLIK